MKRHGDWMQTFTGRQYWPCDPRPDEVELEDIAHHLALTCRYNGACARLYSVAEHSVHVAHLVDGALMGEKFTNERNREIIRRALLHDASEAYCHDITRPLKRHLGGYRDIEQANQMAVHDRFGLPWVDAEADALIKLADGAMLLAEQAELMKPPPAPWARLNVPAEMLAAARRRQLGLSWCEAKRAFLARYRELVVT